MELVKEPVPEPSEVWFPVASGLAVVAQQTPRAVTAAPPSEVTFPPQVAEVKPIAEMADVVTAEAPGMKVRSLPLLVPSLLDATSLK